MPKTKSIPVVWTTFAVQNTIDIKKYLQKEFSKKEIDKFAALIHAFEIAVSAFPELYQASSSNPKIRRAVLSKVVSAFYRINKNQIEIIAILDNRCDFSKVIK